MFSCQLSVLSCFQFWLHIFFASFPFLYYWIILFLILLCICHFLFLKSLTSSQEVYTWSYQNIASSCCSALFACFNTSLLPPSPLTRITFELLHQKSSHFKEIFFFSSLFFLSLEIHAFKAPECTVSIISLICCNISFSTLSKCNLVPLRTTQNAARKIILLIPLLDDVSTVPAVSHQANYYSTFYRYMITDARIICFRFSM